MDAEYERQLESDIDQELKHLGEMPAPGTLLRRVADALEQRAHAPWYRRSWQYWPVPLQWAATACLVALFVGLCLAGIQLLQTEPVRVASNNLRVCYSGFSSAAHTLGILLNAGLLLFKQMGTGLMAGCLVAAALLYAVCLGLGSLCFRLANIHR